LHPTAQELAQTLLNQQERILERFQQVLDQKITALRIRCHDHYHLGQVLYTGKDFILIDFEGNPARTLSERRMKRSPLRDVAAMLQSFNAAVTIALEQEIESGMAQPTQVAVMEHWQQFWYSSVTAVFLDAYFSTAQNGSFLPKTDQEIESLLNAYLLEQAIDELSQTLSQGGDRVESLLRRTLHLSNGQSLIV
jgi:maltose alpha-D-glucosyltransferase/alpha-amylase